MYDDALLVKCVSDVFSIKYVRWIRFIMQKIFQNEEIHDKK